MLTGDEAVQAGARALYERDHTEPWADLPEARRWVYLDEARCVLDAVRAEARRP